MDCKAALTASGGDMEAAIDHLRKKGPCGGREEVFADRLRGVVCAHVEGNSGALVEVNCETDFVARTDDFVALAKEVAALVNAKAPRDVDEALTLPAGGGSLGEKLVATVAKIGEKIPSAGSRASRRRRGRPAWSSRTSTPGGRSGSSWRYRVRIDRTPRWPRWPRTSRCRWRPPTRRTSAGTTCPHR